MRFHTLLPALLLAALPAVASAQNAPTDPGSFILGGNASLSTSKTSTTLVGAETEETVTSLFVAPNVQYFVLPGLAVGGRVQASVGWYDDDSYSAYGVGPQVSYFFGRGERPYYPYVTAGLSYSRVDGSEQEARGANAGVGVVFMLSRGVGLDAAVAYNRQNTDLMDNQSIGLALGVTAFAF